MIRDAHRSQSNHFENQQQAQQAARRDAFSVPPHYLNGNTPKLREFYSGDWWLNVNYVER